MKKPVVDYRELRLSNINEPRFKHLWLLLGWVVYFAMYFLTENLIPAESCRVVHLPVDDMIPFCEVFVIPYLGWFLLVAGSLGYFLLYDIKSFRELQTYIIVTQIVAMAVYILLPNRQDLRPDTFPRENFLTSVVAFIYAFDTSTGVCPSLHCAYSFGIASAWLHRKESPAAWKVTVVVLVIIICLATFFIKQHSTADFLAAIPVGLLAEAIVYGKTWKEKQAKSKP